ncbi:hypothetical protein BGX27_008763 [Mortierella sp. AM989]|nr:hypothetical protein BGX27_008763 [Mortierella sp. AM989]
MDMETVSQILLGNHPSWEFLNNTETSSRILQHHREKPLVLPLLALLPFFLTALFRFYTISPVVLSYNKSPVQIKIYNKKTGKVQSENFIEYVREKCPSLFDPAKAVFKPTLWMTGGHLQTAYAAYRSYKNLYRIDYQRELLDAPDGGTIAVDWAPSFTEKSVDDTPTLVFLHGLTGGSHESYIRALVEVMTRDHGYRCAVFNARACADSPLTSAKLYCGAYTDDLRMIVKHIRKILPEAKLMGIGFSLGANILMNYMGEEGDKCELMGAMSVGNPYDLLGTCSNIERGYLQRKIYSPVMCASLKTLFFKHTKMFVNSTIVDMEEVRRAITVRQFDNSVTCKIFGYRTVNEFYRMGSSSQRIIDIKRPFLCLSALDDPIAVEWCIPRDEVTENPFGLLATTSRGGHLGWFQGFFSQDRWCTKPLEEFCLAMFEADIRPISKSPEYMKYN